MPVVLTKLPKSLLIATVMLMDMAVMCKSRYQNIMMLRNGIKNQSSIRLLLWEVLSAFACLANRS